MKKEDAVKAGDVGSGTFHHKFLRNSDGTPRRCRVNGKCHTWKTRPAEFMLPVKFGLRGNGYITQDNADEWCLTADEAVGITK